MALRRLRFSNWNFLRMGLKFAPYAWEAWVSPWKSSDNLDAGGNLFPLFLWLTDTEQLLSTSCDSFSLWDTLYIQKTRVLAGIPQSALKLFLVPSFLFTPDVSGAFHTKDYFYFWAASWGLFKAARELVLPSEIQASEKILEPVFPPLSWWPLKVSELKSFSILVE